MDREQNLDWLYRLRSEIYVYMPKEWLIPMNNALDAAIESLQAIPSAEPKKCKDCKWWRDSDGAYRRGFNAESRCHINTITVANGWGYCYMFEPQERSDKE